MPEAINNKNVFSLIEVTRSIEKTLAERYKSAFWVQAEMNKLNHYSHSGHCYPDLVEKKDGKVIAQMRANLWKTDYIKVNDNFLRVLKEPLKDGIKILFLAKISFNPAYGLSLRIVDIDPAYTLGDLEKEKQETINKIKSEGIFSKNKALQLPLLPQRIAIISVETSKGYADFLNVIDENEWGYKFFHFLFPALLQGDKAVESICNQLDQIRKVSFHFDVVAIIRGGGGDIGLSCYNHYQLVREIALFPLPVLTGIGHATNETVAEMVSNINVITPTKMAEFLLQKFHNFSVPVNDARKKIIDKTSRLLNEEKSKFHSEAKLFRSVTHNILFMNRNDLQESIHTFTQHSHFLFRNERTYLSSVKAGLGKGSRSLLIADNQKIMQVQGRFAGRLLLYIKDRNHELTNLEKDISNMSPENVLKRGYSITRLGGKAVKDIDNLKSGDLIDTIIYKGKISSRVEEVGSIK